VTIRYEPAEVRHRFGRGYGTALLPQPHGFEGGVAVDEGLPAGKFPVAILSEPSGFLKSQLYAASPPSRMPAANSQDAIVVEVAELLRCFPLYLAAWWARSPPSRPYIRFSASPRIWRARIESRSHPCWPPASP
jgi:hypothetical protein